MIQLYPRMDTIMTSLWRFVTGRHPAPARTRDGPRVLPAYAALARYRSNLVDVDPRLRTLVTQLAAERRRCRWGIERGRHSSREAPLPVHELRALPRSHSSPL